MDVRLKELTEVFRRLGANQPESWAASQLKEGIPQLHRFLFLRAAWSHVIKDGDTAWIENEIEYARKQPQSPGAGVGPALDRLLQAGVDSHDIATVVRNKQWQLLSDLCHQIDDPGVIEMLPRDGEMPHLGWVLMATDERGEVVGPIEGIHESVLETDPTGHEMRPC